MSSSDSWDELIDAYLDGCLDEDQVRELNQWITESPENAAQFAERSYMHSHLVDWAKAKGRQTIVEGVFSEDDPPKRRRVRPRSIVLAVAAALVALLALTQSLWWQPSPGEPVAQLISAPGAKITYLNRSLSASANDVMRSGEYLVEAGLVSIRYESGVEILIESPAEFRLDSAELITMDRGKLSAIVPPEGIGFKVDTPSAQVVDYGTEFAVDVSSDRSSEIYVFSGEVEVTPVIDDNAEPVRLYTEAATRVEYQSDVPMGIPFDGQRFFRSIAEPNLRHSRVVQELDPALYYRMAVAKDGISILDRANGNDGLVVTRGSKRPAFAPGKIGSAGRFEGPKDGAFVYVPSYPHAESQRLSGSFWVRAQSLPRKGVIASNAAHHREGQFELGLVRDTGKLAIAVQDRNGNKVTAKTSEPFPIGTWHHVAFVADGSELRLYIDGEFIDQQPCDGLVKADWAPVLGIGARPNDRKKTATHFWHGRIDEVALFHHPLSEQAIRALYINSQPVR